MMKKSKTLQIKFLIISMTCFTSFAFLSAWYLNNIEVKRFEEEIKKRYEVILSFGEASQQYITDQLRPKIYQYTDNFIIEAMSSKFIINKIFKNFQEILPEYSYRQPSLNPLNHEHIANKKEKEILLKIKKKSDLKEISGYYTIKNKKYFFIAKGIYVKQSCLICHGNVDSAPDEILKKYGNKSGYNWKPGELISAAIFSVSTKDLDYSQNSINKTVFSIFSILTLLLILTNNLLFRKLIINRLNKIIKIMGMVSLNPYKKYFIKENIDDEIGLLAKQFNNMIDILFNTQEALLKKNKYVENIVSSVPSGLMLIKDGTISSANNNFYSISGLNEEDLIKKPVNIFFKNTDFSFDDVEYLSSKTFSDQLEIEYNLPGKNKKFLRMNFASLEEKETILLFNNITQEKKDKIALQKTNQELEIKNKEIDKAYNKLKKLDQMKDDIFALVSHELRTPLSSIIGYADSLLECDLTSVEQDNFLHIIIDESERLSRLINDFLDMAQIAAGRFILKISDIKLDDLIDNSLKIIQNIAFEKKIIIEYQHSSIKIMGDYDRILQVIINLLSNAVKFSPEKGKIKITTDHNKNNLKISVSDEGIGIPEEKLEKIFDRFYTLKQKSSLVKGSGLGLTISKKIIEAHEGKIWVKNNAKSGATFTFTLPF